MNTKQKRKLIKIIISVLTILVIFIGLYFAILKFCQIEKYTVKGNSRYSEEEIIKIVNNTKFDKYSLGMKFHYMLGFDKNQIPSLSKIKISLKGLNSVEIKVKECELKYGFGRKNLCYYINKNNYVVYKTTSPVNNVKLINASIAKGFTLYHKPSDNILENISVVDKILKFDAKNKISIVSISINNEKYDISTSKLLIKLGSSENLSIKLEQIPNIMDILKNESGILNLELYEGDSDTIIFKNNNI